MGVRVDGKILTMRSQLTGDVLQDHIGHKIVIVTYGKPAQNIALECEDCNATLTDCDVE